MLGPSVQRLDNFIPIVVQKMLWCFAMFRLLYYGVCDAEIIIWFGRFLFPRSKKIINFQKTASKIGRKCRCRHKIFGLGLERNNNLVLSG